MQTKDDTTLKQNVLVILRDRDGCVKGLRELHNLVPTAGKNAVAEQLLAAPAKEPPTHMAVGKGATEAKAVDTTLDEELDRNALASKTRENAIVTMKAEWAAGDGTGTIVEAGLFNAAAEGDLYARAVFGAITKEAEDTLEITWTFEVG